MPSQPASSSVVRVKARGAGTASEGTGFLIHRDQAGLTYILTCRHVVYGSASPGQPDSVFVDEQPAEVVWASERQKDEEREADLAVLACAASELADRPILPLGKPLAPRQYKIVSYLQLASAEGREPEHPATTWHPFIGQTPQSFELGNDSAKRIGHGDSGSPVMDADTGLVVGVVADVMAILTGGSENGVIVATSIDQLRQWPGMPSDLVIRTPRLPSAALWGAAGLTPGTPVRILVAASDGLDNELAIVRETIDKIRHAPAARSFPVTLTGWDEIVSGETAPRNRFFWEQRLEGFHGLILIAGSNLARSAAGLGLEVPERATRDSRKSDGHQRGLIYRLVSGDDGTPAGEPPDGAEVARYFEELDRDEVPYVKCAADKFPEQFWSDFQSRFHYLIERSLYPRQEGPAVPVSTQSEVTNPYLGLKSYRSEDGWRFHGRANEVTELRNRLAPRPRFLAVVGPSGCGKSSLVRAGLLYRLKLNAIAGSGAWKAIDIKISETDERYGRPQPPLTTAAFEINRIIPEADRYKRTVDLEDRLRDGRDLDQVINLALKDRGDDARLVILIDQFEEAFTVVTDHDERAGFLSAVRDLSTRPRVYVIISIRDDFYGRLMDTGLADSDPYVVRPASVQSLFSAIYYPAALSGYSFEDESLPLEILEDAGTGVGALPLLSYALEKLVEAALTRRGTVRAWELTREDYEKIGKVQGAIQATADEAVKDLKIGPKTMGRLFRRLVTVDDQGKAAKKPALIDPQDPNWTEQEERLMDALIDARLLVSHLEDAPSPASAPRRIVVEIAHEALLRNWTVLTKWVADSRDALVLMQDVEKEARNWARERAKAATIKDALDIDRQMLWPQERLEKVYGAIEVLGLSSANLQTSEPWRSARSAAAGASSGASSGSAAASVSAPQPPRRAGNGLSEQVERFIQPEPDRLIKELRFPVVGHTRRAEIGERLAQLGDRRPGVALTESGLPDIAWLRVPGGRVNLVDTTGQTVATFDVKPFHIAQYPVTMRQFDVFARPNVYFDKRWWVDLAADPDNHPVFPQKPGTANHPAQFVSFYQGVAFCNWLSRQLGYRVRLPAEWEWQQSATGGMDGYLYPWGPAWDPDRANHRDGAYKLMAVGMYPDGRSPVGAYDLSGNMYEWCANEFDSPAEVSPTGTNARTTRGGAFFGTEADLRVTHRLRDNANGVNDLGKRIGVCIRLAADAPTGGVVEP